MGVKRKEVKKIPKARRFEIIRDLLSEVGPGIRTIQDALQESADESNTDYIVVAALGRLGWIVEQANMLAGYKYGRFVGAADVWLLGSHNLLSETRQETRRAARAARESRASGS